MSVKHEPYMTQALYTASPTTKVIIKTDITKYFMLKNIKKMAISIKNLWPFITSMVW